MCLYMISHENENQFLIFLIVYYLIDPDFVTLYRKKNFKILSNFTRMGFLRLAKSRNFVILQLLKRFGIRPINSLQNDT